MSCTFVKNCCSLSLAVFAFLTLGLSTAFPQAGSLDTSFDPPFTPQVNMDSRALAELPNGAILVGFLHSNEPRSNDVYLARLNADGSPVSLEPPFPGVFTNFGRGISVLSALSDGSVLVGGIFSLGTNAAFSTLTRLNNDGTWDTNFDHAEINGRITCLTVQTDGRILVGGQFSHVQGVRRTNIARLYPDGSLDASFTPPSLGPVRFNVAPIVNGITVQSNKAIIGGQFGSVDGATRRNVARLNPDGSHDESFDPPTMFTWSGGNPSVLSVTVDEAERILITGQFLQLAGQPAVHVGRLQPNGSLDTSFSAPIDETSIVVHNVALEPGGKIVIAGGFNTTGAVVRADVARLNNDGSVDASFDAGDVQGAANRLIRLRDGKYLIGGQPQAINGVPRFFAARLMGDTNAGPGKIQFITRSFEASEDNPRPAQLVAARSDGGMGAISVEFSTVAGTATEADFSSTNGHVRFGDGDFTPKTIDIELVNDPWKEGSEEFTVVLANPQGGAAVGQANIATVRIKGNDSIGSVDTTFAPGFAVGGLASFSMVHAIHSQPDGRLVVGGLFEPLHNTNSSHLTRLNSDGSLDETFALGTGFDAEVRALAAQPNGHILIGGDFGTFNGANVNGLVRLDAQGRLDQTFSAGQGADGRIYAIGVEAGGNILIGGEFERVDDVNRLGLARLNSAGALQPLDVRLSGDGYASVQSIAAMTNGEVYVGGLFESAGGYLRNGLFRLLANGTVDPAFRPATVTNQYDANGDYTFIIYSVVPLPDGKVLAGGSFYEVDGEARRGLVCLNGDGSLDRTFIPEFDDSYVVAIVRLANGQLYLGGSFDLPTLPYWIDGVVRLQPNGRIDWSFEPALIDGFANALVLGPDSRIVLGGHFDECSGTPRHNLARLNVEAVSLLTIEKVNGGSVRVSWPASLSNLILEGADDVDAGSWTPATPAIPSSGRYNYTNAFGGARRFYRVVSGP